VQSGRHPSREEPLHGIEEKAHDFSRGMNPTTHDASRMQIALAWLLGHSPVTLPIPGTSSVDHLEENVAASGIELTDDERARLSE
jgi:aryl-alcohol dehydrogenase-like predicted oxidoreductase